MIVIILKKNYIYMQEEIKHVTVPMLNKLIEKGHNIACVLLDDTTNQGKKLQESRTWLPNGWSGQCMLFSINVVSNKIVSVSKEACP